ncbi:lipoprotein-releasing ABC transporter permease subunit LolE [Parashewanella curva]|uniref:Lipoprotein-releasing ABC transporter permease subunit LolE n=1 Tax=Parashewanella curva TaxID=2338552 RepID=A0A3L8PW80_9GAMM|nr:lipoprotein-releasing ABC transporter permease subunit LolE [Parashewanella curva]RLV59707.1 lipoprotein-releasing ABC transporter permease subunit LolE [Parashewanella curva]
MSRLALTIGWRFYRARQSNSFISFISFASTAGIALGVAVLIILLSAMNGFERELENRLLSVIPQAEIGGVDQPLQHWQPILQQAKQLDGVVDAAPFVKIHGLVQKLDGFQGLEVVGIDTKQESKVSAIPKFMSAEAWSSLAKGRGNHIVVGENLLTKLNLKVGDIVSLYVLDKATDKKQLSAAKSLQFTISGSYKLGGDLEVMTAYAPMDYLQKAINYQQGVSGIRLKVEDVFRANRISRELGFMQEQPVYMTDWTRSQGHVYNDIQLVRMVMYLALTLVIAVACFNVVSTLVMSVRDKQSEIAILLTMGFKKYQMMQVFMIQGVLNGLLGCAFGVTVGVLVALNLTELALILEKLFSFKILAGDVYFINFLPSHLHLKDVYLSVFLALLLSLLSTIYPAWMASKVHPARALSMG